MLNVHIPKSIREITDVFDDVPQKIITDPASAEEHKIPTPPLEAAPLLLNSTYYSHLRHNETNVSLEDGASFCTILCAIDDQRDVLTSHMALVANSRMTAIHHECQELIVSFREQIRQKLTEKYEVLITGMGFSDQKEWNIVYDALLKTFADAQKVQRQLTYNWKRGNSIKDRSCWYSGMLTLPPSLSLDKQLHAFVLNEKIQVEELIRMLL